MKTTTHSIPYFIIYLLCIVANGFTQNVGIGTATPNASARLEVNSTTQGILIPTLTSAQRSAIANPALGLLLFQTDGTPGFYYYNGNYWINLTNGFAANAQGLAVSANYSATSTVAGSGTAGFADATGTLASFDGPAGVAVDAAGNIYVADTDNNRIRKITPGGVVTRLAGSGTGAVDGADAVATFNAPYGIAVDAAGNIYVSDVQNQKIRKMTLLPNGINYTVSTLAGSGAVGASNGTGAAASFNFPNGIAVDAAGNIYVADQYNYLIRKITPGGVVTTLAGSGTPGSANGTGTAASFNVPSGIAVDAAGNVYVGDAQNSLIRKITPAGVVTTLAGSGGHGAADGPGNVATFRFTSGLAIDAAGNVYVADPDNHKIRKVTPGGVVSTLAGDGTVGATDASGAAARFNNPYSVATDAAGNVYVADTGNNKIRKIMAQ